MTGREKREATILTRQKLESWCWNPIGCGVILLIVGYSVTHLGMLQLYLHNLPTHFVTHTKTPKHSSLLQKKTLCLQTCAIRKSHLHPVWICWSSYMGGHCGYYWEVEASIHSAAEVDNKRVIEEGLLGVRGRATRGETRSKIETGANGSVRVSWLNHPLDWVEQIL